MVTTTSFSTLQPSSSATKDAVSKSIIWESDAMTPFFIRHLTTSAPVFFMRLASSPTEISSGILTVSGVFLAISSWRRRIFSASSWRRLLEKVGAPLPFFLFAALRNFSLPALRLSRRPPPALLRSAMSCSFSSYLSRLTLVDLRVSTIFFSGTRVVGCCVAVDLPGAVCPAAGAALGAAACGAAVFAASGCAFAAGAGAALGALAAGAGAAFGSSFFSV